MAVKLHQLSEERAEIAIPVGDEKLEITFRPGAFTPATNAKLKQSMADGTDAQEVVRQLADAIVEWGLLDDEGEQIPVSVEVLSDLPMHIIQEISETIVRSMGPKKESAGD